MKICRQKTRDWKKRGDTARKEMRQRGKDDLTGFLAAFITNMGSMCK